MKINLYISFFLLFLILSCKREVVIDAPIANAGADITTNAGQKVALNGGLSKDPAGGMLTYNWTIKTKPATSIAAIQNPTSATPSFTPDQVGTYVLLLTVTNSSNLTATDEVSIMVSLPGRAPTANAGASLTTTYGNKVVLDGSASSDPDGDKLTYKWGFKTRPAGSATTLAITNDSQVKAEFEPDAIGVYVLTLTVSDGIWPAVSADVTVTVNESPVVTVCPDNSRIEVNTTWRNLVQDPTKPDYIVCRDIEINAVLTVEPGVVVAFKQNAGLHTGYLSGKGIIIAKGTADKPIVFTGEQKIAGFWSGILLLSSNDVRNEFSYVEISYGGGSISSNYYGKPANLNISGARGIGLSTSSAKVTNCTFTNSKGHGVYVSGDGVLTEFSNNQFSNNAAYPLELPGSQVQKLDENSKFAANNGINVVGIYGNVNNPTETTWGPFKDGTKYRFTSSFGIDSGLLILPGSVFEVGSQAAIGVGTNGYLIAKGTADKHIIFTGAVKTPGSWGGILVGFSKDVRNEISYTEVSYGGGEPAYLYAAKGNIILTLGFGQSGRVKVSNCIISNSSEVGIAQYYGALILDNPDSNKYSNNAKGDIGK